MYEIQVLNVEIVSQTSVYNLNSKLIEKKDPKGRGAAKKVSEILERAKVCSLQMYREHAWVQAVILGTRLKKQSNHKGSLLFTCIGALLGRLVFVLVGSKVCVIFCASVLEGGRRKVNSTRSGMGVLNLKLHGGVYSIRVPANKINIMLHIQVSAKKRSRQTLDNDTEVC